MLTRPYNSSREGFEYDDADHAEKDEICMPICGYVT